jgi:VanZ family protein
MVVASTLNFAYAAAMPLIALSHKTPIVGIQDWLLHAFAFGLQVGLLSLVTGPLFSPLAALGAAAAGGLLCGTLVEFLQVFVFGFAFETVDLLADAVGVGLAAALLALPALSRRRPPRDDPQ